MPDSRLTTILGISGTVFAMIATAAIVWGVSTLVSLDKDMAVLLSRPIPVSREQYDRDMEILRSEQRNMRAQLDTIQSRQQAAITRGPTP